MEINLDEITREEHKKIIEAARKNNKEVYNSRLYSRCIGLIFCFLLWVYFTFLSAELIDSFHLEGSRILFFSAVLFFSIFLLVFSLELFEHLNVYNIITRKPVQELELDDECDYYTGDILTKRASKFEVEFDIIIKDVDQENRKVLAYNTETKEELLLTFDELDIDFDFTEL